MSSRMLIIILTTLLFLSSTTAATTENIDKREISSNYIATPSFDIESGLSKKNVDALAAYSFDSNIQYNNTSIPFDVSQTRLENSTEQ